MRQREKEVARGRLARLVAESPVVGEAIEAVVSVFNGEPGKAESFDELHELLEMQPYRLAYWRTAFARDQLPALLRHQHAGRAAGRGSHGLRAHPPAAEGAARRRQGARGPHRSSRRAVRSGAVLLDAAGPGGGGLEHHARARARRPAGSAAVRRGREDSLRPRGAAAPVGGPRDDRLQLPQRSQRPLHRHQPGAPAAPGLRQAHRTPRAVRRRALREQAADHRDGDGERADRAHAHARPHRPEQPQVAGLHARQPARGHRRGRRLLPGLPHLRGRGRLDPRRPRRRRTRHRPRAAAQPGHGSVALRLLPRGDAAARRRHRSAAQRPPRRLSAADRRRTRASGCASP